jgi:tRNA(Ile2) C34 agmatinyltransferase TiaS
MGGGITVPPAGAAIAASVIRERQKVKRVEKCPYCDQANWIPKAHGDVCWSCGYTAPKSERHDDVADSLAYSLYYQANQSQLQMNAQAQLAAQMNQAQWQRAQLQNSFASRVLSGYTGSSIYSLFANLGLYGKRASAE